MAVLRVALLGLVVAGCYDPAVTIGLPCGDGCPAGQTCQGGLCFPPGEGPDAADPADARIDGSAAIDTDGDGVFDDVDNCPGALNADQHDEDSDTVGDVCDGCPHRADPDQSDADGDAVGDACDPGPQRHRIAFFDPFTTDRPEWTFNGPFVRNPDRLDVVADSEVATVAVPIGEATVELGGEISAVAAVLPHQITLIVSDDEATNLVHYCEIFDNGAPHFNLQTAQAGVYNLIDSVGLPDPLPGGTFQLAGTESATTGVAICDLSIAGNGYSIGGAGEIVPTAVWRMHVQHLTVSFRYAIQIELDAP